MKTICFIAPYNYSIPAIQGGAIETLVQHLIEENEKEKKFKFIVLSTYSKEAEEVAKKYKYTKYIYFKKKKYIDKIFYFLFRLFKKIFHAYLPMSFRFKQIIKFLKNNREKIDYIIFEDGMSEMLVLVAKVFPKEKIFSHIHWDGNPDKKVDNSFGTLVPVSDYIGKIWCEKTGRTKESVYVLHNCVDYELFSKKCSEEQKKQLRDKLRIPSDYKVIVYTGRIIEGKGIKELVLAFEKLKESKVLLLIIGSATFGIASMTEYEREVNNLVTNSKKKIRMAGFVKQDDLYKYYNICDLAVMPSIKSEAAGLVGIEMQAAGLPLIATNIGGIPEYTDGKSVMLIDYKENFIEQLRDGIQELLYDSNKMAYMKQCAKINAQKYNLQNYYENFKIMINKFEEKNNAR